MEKYLACVLLSWVEFKGAHDVTAGNDVTKPAFNLFLTACDTERVRVAIGGHIVQ